MAGSETLFELDVAYAYVGECTEHTSYSDTNGILVTRVSQYPSAVVFNITRIPGFKIASCDAVIEVYGVHLETDTGEVENYGYIVGANYSSSFNPDSQLTAFYPYVHHLVDRSLYSGGVIGNLYFNWTDNTSILSLNVGSAGLYSSLNSTLGLWNSGKPNAISVTVNRIGYLTVNSDSVSVYKEATNTKTVASTQLSSYEDGFLHNTLVPQDKITQTNLFEAIPLNQRIQAAK